MLTDEGRNVSFERYKKDIEKLVARGARLYMAMLFSELSEEEKKEIKLTKEELKYPVFTEEYQSWYSESLVCISQIMPDRLEDFASYYKPPKARKDITHENYTVSDYLKGLTVTRGGQKIVGLNSAIPAFEQQVNIVRSLQQRFESSLFDIQALVQADVFDNELDAAEELNKKGFQRGAGAVAGVVLEGHLRAVCKQHKITAPKNAMLGKLNDRLKEKSVLDTPEWRTIQHLTDLRNLCDHKKTKEPTTLNVEELIEGVRKVTKTVF